MCKAGIHYAVTASNFQCQLSHTAAQSTLQLQDTTTIQLTAHQCQNYDIVALDWLMVIVSSMQCSVLTMPARCSAPSPPVFSTIDWSHLLYVRPCKCFQSVIRISKSSSKDFCWQAKALVKQVCLLAGNRYGRIINGICWRYVMAGLANSASVWLQCLWLCCTTSSLGVTVWCIWKDWILSLSIFHIIHISEPYDLPTALEL